MYIAVDFDGTVVVQDGRAYDDLETPLEFLRDPDTGYGARDGLLALKRGGHRLLLWSGRASRSLRIDPGLDPFVRAGARPLNRLEWEARRPIHVARYQQMLDFVAAHLPGVFDAIDDGAAGKPQVDLFLDDKAVRRGPGPGGFGWRALAFLFGDAVPARRVPGEAQAR